MPNNEISYKIIQPDKSIGDFVESFWMLNNNSDNDKEIIVLPDGRVDIFFSYSATEPYHVSLMGLEIAPDKAIFPPKSVIFAISLKLFAIEYLLDISISDLLSKAKTLPLDFWGFSFDDISDFENFCFKATKKIKELLKDRVIDKKKQKLFQFIYSSNGSMQIKEMSEKVFWSSRQINRYFQQQFGLSLKTFCNILRFSSSFKHIKEGKLFPEQNFSDQAHFIKEVKKLSGVTPKELFKNKNDLFIQFSSNTTQELKS